MVSILCTEQEPSPRFYFPKGSMTDRCMRDVLENDVDEGFFLSEKALDYFCRVNNDKSHCHDFKPRGGAGYSLHRALQERTESGRQFSKIVRRGEINSSQDGKVIDANGVSCTLTAGHMNQPKIIYEE